MVRIMVKIPKTAQIAKFIGDGSSSYEKIAIIIQQKGVSTLDELVETTSLSKPTVSRSITMLKREGLVVLTKEKKGRRPLYRWIGGVSTLENELLEATNKHVSASLLAETYDTLITDSFSLFSILFENYCWEVIANLKEGLSDTEIHQRLGNDISLDSIRRIFTTCDAHNLIKINRIREPAGTDFIRLFEPLFRIEYVNRDLLNNLIMLRGLASAIHFEIENKPKEGYAHPYAPLFNLTKKLHSIFLDSSLSFTDKEEAELLLKILSYGYDFVPDLDRIYRSENWRQNVKASKNIMVDEISDHVLLTNDFAKKCKENMIKRIGDDNE